MQSQILHGKELKIGWGKSDQSFGFNPHIPIFTPGGPPFGNHTVNYDMPDNPPAHTLWVGNVHALISEPLLI